MITPRRLAVLYALYGVLAVLLLAVLMPPYQNVDEVAHLVRADQISHAGWIARAGPGAPALIDDGVLAGSQRFVPLQAGKQSRVSADLYAPVGWGGRLVAIYPTSAVYPPVFYLPAALALAVGHHNHLSVLPAIELARAASGIAAVALGALAIMLAGPAGLLLFALLTLPMALAQTASVGQDGMMMACCALAAACLIRLRDGRASRWAGWLALLCLLLALAGQARPPLIALAGLPLAASRAPRGARMAGCVAVALAVIAWSVSSLHASGVDVTHFHGADARAQALGLLAAPWRVVTVLAATLVAYGKIYLEQFEGRLGWLDVVLPHAYLAAALAMLVWAAAASLLAGKGWPRWRGTVLCLACPLAAALGIFAIQYLTWSEPGGALIEGVQGRYFLPLAMLGAVPLSRPIAGRIGLLAWPVLVFPVATIVVTVQCIVLRYYFF